MVELEGEAMAIAVQEAQKVPAVLGVGEYGLSVVTAVHDVVASGRAMLILARWCGPSLVSAVSSTKAMSRPPCSRRRPILSATNRVASCFVKRPLSSPPFLSLSSPAVVQGHWPGRAYSVVTCIKRCNTNPRVLLGSYSAV